jgi:hypothetical protein
VTRDAAVAEVETEQVDVCRGKLVETMLHMTTPCTDSHGG